MKWRLLSLIFLSFLLGIGVFSNISYSAIYRNYGPWYIDEPWDVGPYWVFPPDFDIHTGPPPEKTPSATRLPPAGLPIFIPVEIVPWEAQYGTIALIFIMGGAVIYYLRKPRGARELYKASDKKASKKKVKTSSKIRRKLKKERRKSEKW